MEFKLVDFYTFLIELAFCILFLIIFTSIHYSINNIKKVKNALERNKVGRFFYFFAFGAILASLSFLVSQLCAKTLGTFIGLPIIILGLIFTMTFFYSIAVGAGALIPSIIWVVWAYSDITGTNYDLIARLIVIVIYMGVSFALTLYKDKRWSIFILGSLMVAGTIILCITTVTDESLPYHIFETLSGVLLNFMFLGLIKSINRIFANISNIAINSVYSDQHYLVPESLDQNFNHFIQNNKIDQALVILFEFNDVHNAVVKQQLLDNIHSTFDKKDYKTLFFKTEYNKYGLVLSGKDFYINNLNQSFKGNLFAKRLEKDNLLKLQQMLQSIPLEYEYSTSLFKFNFKAYVSVYGVHSYDINELINDDMFMINNEDDLTKNIVKVFHSVMTEHITNDAIDYATLVQNVNLDEITVSLELVQLNNSKQMYVYPRVYWVRKLLGDYKSIIKTLPSKTANTLLRHLAIKSIELYAKSEYNHKYNLIINYPWEELNSIFYSPINSIQKIKLFGIDPKDVVFCFDAENIREWPRNVLNHLSDFEDLNVKYILLNVNSSTVFNTHKPLFATLSKQAMKSESRLDKIMKVVHKQKVNVLLTMNKQ